jgi:hypothetical protein
VQGKMHNRTFPENPLCAAKPFEQIHSDLREYPVLSYSKCKWYISFIDDCTSAAWVVLLKKKSDAYEATKDFLVMIHTQYGIKVQEWFSDDGSEYVSKKYVTLLKSHGILIYRSVPEQKSMNGRAERFNRTIDTKAEALRFQACLPPSWWEFCVNHAVYLYNRTPVRRVKWVTPIELTDKETLDLSKLKIFGSGAYVFILKDIRKNKLSLKSELMTFLGYRFGHESNMILMRALNNFLFHGTTALFNKTLFPKYPTTKVPPVTQVHNKRKKSTEENPTVVIEFDEDSSDDDDNLLPYSPQPPKAPSGSLQGPDMPPTPPTGPTHFPHTPPSHSTPPTPKTLREQSSPRRVRRDGITTRWNPGPPSSQAGPSGTQGGDDQGGPHRSEQHRVVAQREGNVHQKKGKLYTYHSQSKICRKNSMQCPEYQA